MSGSRTKEMKALNDKEWEELQEIVENQDRIQGNLLGVNLSVATFTIDPEKKYPEVIFDEKGVGKIEKEKDNHN